MDISLPLAFTVGLFSTLHCIGMCGGIMGALSFGLPPETRRQTPRLLLYLLIYNLGRILSYAAAGALMGAAGWTLLAVIGPGQGHRLLQWLAALILVLIGLHIAGWLPRLAGVERFGVPIWRLIEPWGRRLMPVKSPIRALAYGLVWGWLPCGLVYTMLLASTSSQSPVGGALYMAAYGLGTLPAVIATGILAGQLQKVVRTPYLREFIGVMIVVLGLLTLWYPELLDAGPKR